LQETKGIGHHIKKKNTQLPHQHRSYYSLLSN